MSKKLYKHKLYKKVFEGFLEEKDMPKDDRGLYSMFGGLNIVEMGIGQFADLNISIEEQEKMGLNSEELEKRFKDIDYKKEMLITEWRGLVMRYICGVKQFSRGSKQHQEWFNKIIRDFENNPEWTIDMYKWALKFLEVLKCKLISDIITKSLSEKSE